MKFCTKCGKQLPDDANFCNACGQKTDAQQPRVQAAQQSAPARNSQSEPLVKRNPALGITLILAGVAIIVITILLVKAQLG